MGRRKEPTAYLPPLAPLPMTSVYSVGKPIQIGATKISLSLGEKQRKRDQGLFFYCKTPGHIASSCPVKAPATRIRCRTCKSMQDEASKCPA